MLCDDSILLYLLVFFKDVINTNLYFRFDLPVRGKISLLASELQAGRTN